MVTQRLQLRINCTISRNCYTPVSEAAVKRGPEIFGDYENVVEAQSSRRLRPRSYSVNDLRIVTGAPGLRCNDGANRIAVCESLDFSLDKLMGLYSHEISSYNRDRSIKISSDLVYVANPLIIKGSAT